MRAALLALAAALAVGITVPAHAIEKPSIGYMQSLERADRFVFVMEWIDPRLRAAVEREGLASPEPFAPFGEDGTLITISKDRAIKLSGITACDDDTPIQYEDFQGTCRSMAVEGLDIQLRRATVLLCRSFVGNKDRAIQPASCFTYTNIDGVMIAVDNVEEQLVSGGWVFASRRSNGERVRPDLREAESIAINMKMGLWSMRRVPHPMTGREG